MLQIIRIVIAIASVTAAGAGFAAAQENCPRGALDAA
jgi:hypothetical protein